MNSGPVKTASGLATFINQLAVDAAMQEKFRDDPMAVVNNNGSHLDDAERQALLGGEAAAIRAALRLPNA